MSEYLAPGVYVEEVSYSAPTIEGVGTTTTGFAGPTLTGPVGNLPFGGSTVPGTPVGGVPQLLTSFGDFQNIYGGFQGLSFTAGATTINYLAMAVKAFFDNGGAVLYVTRVYAAGAASGYPTSSAGNVVVAARFPGAMLNGQTVTVALTATKTQNVANLPAGSLLGVPGVGGAQPVLYTNGTSGVFMSNAPAPAPLVPSPQTNPATPLPTNLYLLTMQVTAPSASGQPILYNSVGFDAAGPYYLGAVLGLSPPRTIDAQQNQVWFNLASAVSTPAHLFSALFPTWNDPGSATPVTAPMTFTLSGGNDGVPPGPQDYATALSYLTPLEDIAIVATPGASVFPQGNAIMSTSLIEHVEAQRAYRVAILETGPGLVASDYEGVRAQIDSSYAALYVPWVLTPNPLAVSGTSTPAQIAVPPTGFMAGIYARNDEEHSVAKAPANEVVLGAVDFERHISFAEQSVLNPIGVNCLRFFPNRGYRVWGARTVSSDTSLMYINVRRYLIYLEHSIDQGTQWAVFENNGPALWARVTDSIDSFLNNEFASGNLMGTSRSQAYFVRCDRTTMTQNAIDTGQLICLVGVALLKPAEFAIFRVGQMTITAGN
jgi:phage tail sheath protein FI